MERIYTSATKMLLPAPFAHDQKVQNTAGKDKTEAILKVC